LNGDPPPQAGDGVDRSSGSDAIVTTPSRTRAQWHSSSRASPPLRVSSGFGPDSLTLDRVRSTLLPAYAVAGPRALPRRSLVSACASRGSIPPCVVRGERLIPRGSEESRALTGGVERAFACCEALSRIPYSDQEAIRAAWSELTGRPAPEGLRLVPPVHCDHGLELRLARNVFVNHGCTLNDMGGISIGERTMLGPNVSLLTSGHPTAVADRQAGITVAPIAIGSDVWIGAGATVLGGVTVGDGSVVGAGAVVTRDVEPATLVAGVPARPVRALG
jgi:acetyltransferase-like isoleucine patch superfamily enzyme